MNEGSDLPLNEKKILKSPHRKAIGISTKAVLTMAIIMIIISSLGFYFLYGNNVEKVLVLDVIEVAGEDGQYQGIQVRLLVLSGGIRPVNETGKLDVYFEEDIVLSREVKVNSDLVKVNLKYEEFAVANGIYSFRFTLGGVSDNLTNGYYVRHVPGNLLIDVGNIHDPETNEVRSIIILTPDILQYPILEYERYFKPEFYNRYFNIELTVIDPYGEKTVIEKSMYEWDSNRSSLQIDLDWKLAGNYSVSAVFENLLVQSSSDLRKLVTDPEKSRYYVNKPPIIDNITHSSIRTKQTVNISLTVRAHDIESNGAIQYFLINWGDSFYSPYSFDEVISVGKSNSIVTIEHAYNISGCYTILITAADNGINYDVGNGLFFTGKEYAFRSYDVKIENG